MKLEFSFKDVPHDILDIHRNIDLSKNTVIYGNNGRGKTRVLTTVDTIHKIAKKDFEIKLLNLIDDMNLDTLQIDGIDYTELVLERKDENNRRLLDFLNQMSFALRDYISSLKSLAESSYIFNEILGQSIRVLSEYIDFIHRGRKRRLLSFKGFEQNIRDSHRLLKKIRNEFSHSETFTFFVNLDRIEILEDLQTCLTINEFLIRSIEDSKYSYWEFDFESVEQVKLEMQKTLQSSSSYYVSPSTDFELIQGHIEDSIEENINLYGQTFFDSEEVRKNTRVSLEKNFDSIKSKLDRINSLLISGYGGLKIIIKDRKISFQKKQKKQFYDLPKEKLSSGEKRIIKLFLSITFGPAKLYLIDEPEVSLSLNFQSKLINDLLLLCSIEGRKMILATHAPYVFKDCLANDFERLEL